MTESAASRASATTLIPPLQGKKPGLRLLSLDGGGIRGYSELCILEKLMVSLHNEPLSPSGEIPKPCDIFDMICGTSTGGLIAIMLGRLRMSIEECMTSYSNFAKEVFGDPTPGWKMQDGKYKASKLEKVVKEIVKAQKQGEKMLDTRPGSCKVFVCATPAAAVSRARRLRTYDSGMAGDCAIWEAARATSAAPYFFEAAEISIRPGVTERFVDGALGHNNPVLEIHSEAREVFPSQEIDCIISIGTGSARHGSVPRPRLWETIIPTNIIDALKSIALSCERSHEEMLERFAEIPDVYHRFSEDVGPDKIGLDEWKKIGDVQSRTITYMEKPDVRQQIAAAAGVLRRSLNSPEILSMSVRSALASKEMIDSKGHVMEINQLFSGEEETLKPTREYLTQSDSISIGDQEMNEFLSKLEVDSSTMYGVRKNKVARYDGTCEWIYPKKEYDDWRGKDGPRILLIVAPPGQGKSTLAKYLAEEIKSEVESSSSCVVLEYFCHDSHGHNTATVVMQSFIYQLLADRPHLHQLVHHRNNRLKERNRELNPEILWEIFIAVLESLQIQSVYCFLDGLDECEDASQDILWKFLETQFVEKKRSAESIARKFRILLTSRPTALAKQIGHLSHELEIQRADVDPDIARFIRHRVDRMTSTGLIPSDMSKIVTELLDTGAGGMFLWASQSLDQIENFEEGLSFFDILDILKNVPKDIKGLYKRALERVYSNERFRERSGKIFEILLIAGDSLEIKAFALAMTQWPDTCTTHAELQQRCDMRFEYTSKRVCGSIIRVVDGTIQLFHPSARDFLLNDAISHGLFSFDERMCHARLAQVCLRYLLLSDLDLENSDAETNKKDFPLLRYALTYWPLHLRSSQDAIWTFNGLLRRFFLPSNLIRLSDYLKLAQHFKQTGHGNEEEAIVVHYLIPHDLSNVLQAVKFQPGILGNVNIPSKPISAKWEVNVRVDVKNGVGQTPLMVAASFASLSTVQTLLNQGADADAVSDTYNTALHFAAAGADVGILRALIGQTSNIDCRDMKGNTPLLLATDLQVINALLDGGAEIDGRKNGGKTSLILAAQEGNFSIFMTLFRRGATLDTISNDGWTPLYASANTGNIPILEVLLDKRVAVIAETDKGWNPLHAASSNGYAEAVTMLLKYGIDPNSKTKSSFTPLHLASSEGHVKVVDILLNSGAEVTISTIYDEMPIHSAASRGKADCVAQLIRAGSPVHINSKFDDTPLSLALLHGHFQTIKVLLENRADRSFITASKPLITAIKRDDFDILEFILTHSNNRFDDKTICEEIMASPGWMRNLEMVRLLVDHGFDPKFINSRGKSTVFAAVMLGAKEAVSLFIELGADSARANKSGSTPLHIAAYNGLDDILSILLSHGASVNAQNCILRTPLYDAVFSRSYGCIELLIKAGSSPLTVDQSGLSAIDLAAASPSCFARMANWRETYRPKDQGQRVADFDAERTSILRNLGHLYSEKHLSSDQRHEKLRTLGALFTNLFRSGEYESYRVTVLLGQTKHAHPDFNRRFMCDMCDDYINTKKEGLRRCKTCIWDICKACMKRYDEPRTPDDRLCSGHEFLTIDIHEWDQLEPKNVDGPEKEVIVREKWFADMQQKFGGEAQSTQEASNTS